MTFIHAWTPFSTRLAISSEIPSSSTILTWDVSPLRMVMEDFEIFNILLNKLMTALLADPFSGAAVTFILKTSPSNPINAFTDDLGKTFTLILITLLPNILNFWLNPNDIY